MFFFPLFQFKQDGKINNRARVNTYTIWIQMYLKRNINKV